MKKVVLLIILLAITKVRTVAGLGGCMAWSEVTIDSRKGLSCVNSPVRWRWQKVVPQFSSQTFPWHISIWQNWELYPHLTLMFRGPFESLGLVCRNCSPCSVLICRSKPVDTPWDVTVCWFCRVGSTALLVVTGNVLHHCWTQNYLWVFLRVPL